MSDKLEKLRMINLDNTWTRVYNISGIYFDIILVF